MQFGGLAAFAMFAAVAGGVVWLVVRSRRLERQADFDRSVRARKLGWRYDGTREGRIDYRFAGERSAAPSGSARDTARDTARTFGGEPSGAYDS